MSTGGGGGEAKLKRYVLRCLLKVATKVAECTDSGRLFQREGAHELKALAPVLVLILGMDRGFHCLISVSVMEEKWQSKSEGKLAVPHEEPCRSASRS